MTFKNKIYISNKMFKSRGIVYFDLDDLPKKSGIYLWINLINGKIYVGCAINLYDRINRTYPSEIKSEDNRPILNALREYGFENFRLEILHIFDESIDKWTLIALETAFIDEYDALTKFGNYNINLFGNSSYGVKRSKETREKIRQFNLGKELTQEHKKNLSIAGKKLYENGYVNPNKDKTVSEETKQKISKNNTGKKRSKEQCENISKSLIGKYVGENNANFGRIVSEEQKEKTAKTWELKRQNGWISPIKGIKKSENHCRNISKNHARYWLNKHKSKETKKKIGEKSKLQDHSWKQKAIKQIDPITGEVIKIWNSLKEAAIFFNLKNRSPICSVLKGRSKISCGYKWEYV